MLHVAASIHALGVSLASRAHAKVTATPERGSDTIEKVLWAVAVIAIVGIVGTAITNFVTSEAAKIK